MSVQYCRGCSVLSGIASVLQRDSINTEEAVQYCGGIASVHVGITSIQVGDSISTMEAIQCCRGIASVLQRDSISTARDSIITAGK